MYPYELKSEAFHGYSQDGELLEMEQFEYLESEVNRNSLGYIRWVQESLNKLLRLRLKVDGIIGQQTRSAIRRFQQRQGLVADGIIGEKTESALKAALGETPITPSILPLSTPTPRVLTYTTRDVIDKRISMPAQHSLVRLSKNSATSTDAVGMLEDVKAGRLAGIYCVNWEKPAQRALRMGSAWWTVIPPGEDAILMPDPDDLVNGTPLIAFRRELDPRKEGCGPLKTDTALIPSPSRLDNALIKVWRSFRSPPCLSREQFERSVVSWLQLSLNQVLGLRLQQSGVMSVATRSGLRAYQRLKGLPATGSMNALTLRHFQLEGCGSPPVKKGVHFDIKKSSTNLYEATRLTVNDIVNQLRDYFGIAANVLEYPGSTWLGLFGNDGYLLYLIDSIGNECQNKIDEANNKWKQIESEVKRKASDPPTGADHVRELNKFRDWLITWLRQSHKINITTSEESYKTWGRGSTIDGNSYTWWVIDRTSRNWVRTMDKSRRTASSQEAAIIMGPLMLLAHEAEHDTGKTVAGAALPGSGDRLGEEAMVIKDIDHYAALHPKLIQRYRWEVESCRYSQFVPYWMIKNPLTNTEPSPPIEWVKWPCQSELKNGTT